VEWEAENLVGEGYTRGVGGREYRGGGVHTWSGRQRISWGRGTHVEWEAENIISAGTHAEWRAQRVVEGGAAN
jgi:hypothetical protein